MDSVSPAELDAIRARWAVRLAFIPRAPDPDAQDVRRLLRAIDLNDMLAAEGDLRHRCLVAVVEGDAATWARMVPEAWRRYLLTKGWRNRGGDSVEAWVRDEPCGALGIGPNTTQEHVSWMLADAVGEGENRIPLLVLADVLYEAACLEERAETR